MPEKKEDTTPPLLPLPGCEQLAGLIRRATAHPIRGLALQVAIAPADRVPIVRFAVDIDLLEMLCDAMPALGYKLSLSMESDHIIFMFIAAVHGSRWP